MNFNKDGKCICSSCSAPPSPIVSQDFSETIGWRGIVLVVALGAAFILVTAIGIAFASDVSSCGIKPPPPISCIHCQATCQCNVEGKCGWIYVARGRR